MPAIIDFPRVRTAGASDAARSPVGLPCPSFRPPCRSVCPRTRNPLASMQAGAECRKTGLPRPGRFAGPVASPQLLKQDPGPENRMVTNGLSSLTLRVTMSHEVVKSPAREQPRARDDAGRGRDLQARPARRPGSPPHLRTPAARPRDGFAEESRLRLSGSYRSLPARLQAVLRPPAHIRPSPRSKLSWVWAEPERPGRRPDLRISKARLPARIVASDGRTAAAGPASPSACSGRADSMKLTTISARNTCRSRPRLRHRTVRMHRAPSAKTGRPDVHSDN